MTIELTEKQAGLVKRLTSDGTFASVEAMLDAAFEQLEWELEDLGDVKALREAIEKGMSSGIAEEGVVERILAKHGLSSRAA